MSRASGCSGKVNLHWTSSGKCSAVLVDSMGSSGRGWGGTANECVSVADEADLGHLFD